MKKLISAFLTGVILTVSSSFVYAADGATTIALNTAAYDKTTSKVNVECTVTDAAASQSITVMSTGINNNTYNVDDIVYIDQFDNAKIGTDNKYSFSFALSDSADVTTAGNTSYCVRIGGTNVAEPVYMAIIFTGGGVETVLLGDVNDDKKVDINDAVALLEYVQKGGDQIKNKKNVQFYKENKTTLTAKEASMIVQKVLNSSYKFPAEAQ